LFYSSISLREIRILVITYKLPLQSAKILIFIFDQKSLLAALRKYLLQIICLLVIFLYGLFAAQAQNTIGIPMIVNYSNQLYNAGSQNWGIAQDKKGILYFANNEGLLTFDGSFWRKYPLPNKTKARSVTIAKDGRIYVGGQSELGYFSANGKGELIYTSLMPLIADREKDFTDVWNVCIFQDQVFFRAYRKLFAYDGRRIVVHPGLQWNYLGVTPSALFALNNDRQLLAYRNGKWGLASRNNLFPPDVVLRSVVEVGKDSTLLVTLAHGLFILHKDSMLPFRSKDLATISSYNIYGASRIDPDRIALNTNLSGCIIINKKGEFIQRISKSEGLQNNNILCMLPDKDKNLWFGLDNGIDLALFSNAIQQIFPEGSDRNAGYASIIHQNKLYLGLVSGAYAVLLNNDRDLSYTKGSFRPLKGSKGQVWNFSVVNDKLLMGHNRGAFLIDNDSARLIDGSTGFWGFQPLRLYNGSQGMLGGTYNGISFYHFEKDRIVNQQNRAHFESARFVVQYKNSIWSSHPFKGLFRVQYDGGGAPVVTSYNDRQGILSPNHNKLFSIDKKLILLTDKGIFEYDDGKEDFFRSATFDLLPKVGVVNYLKQDRYGNVWFTTADQVGVFDRAEKGSRIVFIPELNNKIQSNGFEQIHIIDSNNVLLTGENGFFHLNYAQYKKAHYPLHARVSKINYITGNDSLLYGGYAEASKPAPISYAYNSLHFEVASTLFGHESTVEYSFYLDGFDKGWSEWTKRTEKEYTNLPPGDYVFKVRCRNNFDNESPVTTYSFTVLPPWYRTWWAYAVYGLMIAGVLYFFYKKQQNKYKLQHGLKLLEQQRENEEEQKRLRMLHRLTVAENERKISILQQEKLQAEIEHKNSELATSAMNLVHKAEILSKLKEDLLQFRESTKQENGTKEFQKIIKVIDAELNHAGEWEQFARHFDSVHANYLKKLKEQYPDLTTSELKLAAYLRLNLSTKEIAQLLNISVRGVETSRYRLRKKLGLTNEDANLYGFLMEITK
jgi:DNA-binding CsgD family transcriptional regulator/ligand-binding sensor domain-containing protein